MTYNHRSYLVLAVACYITWIFFYVFLYLFTAHHTTHTHYTLGFWFT